MVNGSSQNMRKLSSASKLSNATRSNAVKMPHIYIPKGTSRERDFPEMYESPWDDGKTYVMKLFDVTENKNITRKAVYHEPSKDRGIWRNMSYHTINLEGYTNVEVSCIPVGAHCAVAAANTKDGIKYYLNPIDSPHRLPASCSRRT